MFASKSSVWNQLQPTSACTQVLFVRAGKTIWIASCTKTMDNVIHSVMFSFSFAVDAQESWFPCLLQEKWYLQQMLSCPLQLHPLLNKGCTLLFEHERWYVANVCIYRYPHPIVSIYQCRFRLFYHMDALSILSVRRSKTNQLQNKPGAHLTSTSVTLPARRKESVDVRDVFW